MRAMPQPSYIPSPVSPARAKVSSSYIPSPLTPVRNKVSVTAQPVAVDHHDDATTDGISLMGDGSVVDAERCANMERMANRLLTVATQSPTTPTTTTSSSHSSVRDTTKSDKKCVLEQEFESFCRDAHARGAKTVTGMILKKHKQRPNEAKVYISKKMNDTAISIQIEKSLDHTTTTTAHDEWAQTVTQSLLPKEKEEVLSNTSDNNKKKKKQSAEEKSTTKKSAPKKEKNKKDSRDLVNPKRSFSDKDEDLDKQRVKELLTSIYRDEGAQDIPREIISGQSSVVSAATFPASTTMDSPVAVKKTKKTSKKKTEKILPPVPPLITPELHSDDTSDKKKKKKKEKVKEITTTTKTTTATPTPVESVSSRLSRKDSSNSSNSKPKRGKSLDTRSSKNGSLAKGKVEEPVDNTSSTYSMESSSLSRPDATPIKSNTSSRSKSVDPSRRRLETIPNYSSNTDYYSIKTPSVQSRSFPREASGIVFTRPEDRMALQAPKMRQGRRIPLEP
jgi:hypothetical protein